MLTPITNVSVLKTYNQPPQINKNVSFKINEKLGSQDSITFTAKVHPEHKDCKKSGLTTTVAYLWSKAMDKIKPDTYILTGSLNEVKQLKKAGTVLVFAVKHYDNKDIPGFVKVFNFISDSKSDFQEEFPHLMRGQSARENTLKDKVLHKLDKGLGCFFVDNTGGGKGRAALIKSLKLVESKENIYIFPEGGDALKLKGEPISEEKQVVQPIKNGLSHIISRLIANKENGEYEETFNVAVVPVGVSGETGKDGKPASIFVGKPINVFEDLTNKVLSNSDLYYRVNVLNDVFQQSLQSAQNSAYKAYNDKMANKDTH